MNVKKIPATKRLLASRTESDKLTARQEAFCQAFATGKTSTEAYRAAYTCERMKSTTVTRRGFDVFQLPHIKTRIAEIGVPIRAAVQYGVIEAMQEADMVLKFAIQHTNPSAAVAAVALRAKLSGLLIDRKEIKSGPLDNMSHDDTRRLLAVIDGFSKKVITPAITSGSIGGDTQAVPE